jgi:hypothetical protein
MEAQSKACQWAKQMSLSLSACIPIELDSLPHRFRQTICSANRSALSEKAAQGNLSQFNGLEFLLPWFGTS